MQNLYIVTPNSIADGELDDITRLKYPQFLHLFVRFPKITTWFHWTRSSYHRKKFTTRSLRWKLVIHRVLMAHEMAKKPRYIYAEFATFFLVLMCLGSLNLCEGNFTLPLFILITMQRRRSSLSGENMKIMFLLYRDAHSSYVVRHQGSET